MEHVDAIRIVEQRKQFLLTLQYESIHIARHPLNKIAIFVGY